VLIAIENMQCLVPRSCKKLACRCFSNPGLPDQEGGFVVLQTSFQEIVSADLAHKVSYLYDGGESNR
jgi:hypothetical protein